VSGQVQLFCIDIASTDKEEIMEKKGRTARTETRSFTLIELLVKTACFSSDLAKAIKV